MPAAITPEHELALALTGGDPDKVARANELLANRPNNLRGIAALLNLPDALVRMNEGKSPALAWAMSEPVQLRPGLDPAGAGFQHSHIHRHPNGVLHSHQHGHAPGTAPHAHGQEADAPHRHGHDQGITEQLTAKPLPAGTPPIAMSDTEGATRSTAMTGEGAPDAGGAFKHTHEYVQGGQKKTGSHWHSAGVPPHAAGTDISHEDVDVPKGSLAAGSADRYAQARQTPPGPVTALSEQDSVLLAAKHRQQAIFKETGVRPDSILKAKRRGERDTVANTLSAAIAAELRERSQAKQAVALGEAKALAERELSVAEKLQAAAKAHIDAARQRGQVVTFGEALKAVAASDYTTPTSLPAARSVGDSFIAPPPPNGAGWQWNSSTRAWERHAGQYEEAKARTLGQPQADETGVGVGQEFAEQTWQERYDALKARTLGQPAEPKLNQTQARRAAHRLSEQVKVTSPKPGFVNDNLDLVTAAEEIQERDYTRFGRQTPLRRALLEADRQRALATKERR